MLLPIAKDDKAEPQMPALPIPDPEKIDWSEVIGVKYTSRFTVYLLRGARLTFLLIPHSAFQSVEKKNDCQRRIERLNIRPNYLYSHK